MTSIFTRGFDDILERINSSKRSASTTVTQKADFSKVLESKSLESVEKERTSHRPEPRLLEFAEPATHLTNMDAGEIKNVSIQGPGRFAIPPEETLLSVKDPAETVKISAPEPPEVLSVRWASQPVQISFEKHELKAMISSAGRFHGVDPSLGIAVAQAESSLQVDAVSQDGHASKGLFQLLDTTAQDMMRLHGMENETYDPFDPSLNTFLGMGYLRRLHDLFSTESQLTRNTRTVGAESAASLEKLAVAAFNAGEGRVARAQAKVQAEGGNPADFGSVEPHLPASTRAYVRRVFEFKTQVEGPSSLA